MKNLCLVAGHSYIARDTISLKEQLIIRCKQPFPTEKQKPLRKIVVSICHFLRWGLQGFTKNEPVTPQKKSASRLGSAPIVEIIKKP